MMLVYLSQSAYDQLHETLDYLELNWSPAVSDNFLDKLERTMDIISNMPYAFPKSEKFPGLHKCVITRHSVAWYRVDEIRKEVEIMAVLDSRRDLG